jgi:hypothetical protein
MAPEYAMRGTYLTDKADVYSFGIVALEIVSGKSNTSHRTKEDTIYLLDWVERVSRRLDLFIFIIIIVLNYIYPSCFLGIGLEGERDFAGAC